MDELPNNNVLKTCFTCKETKSLSGDFWKGQSCCINCSKIKQKNYWQSRNPKRRLEQHLKYKYKLTIKELYETLEKQDNCCAICYEQLPDLLVYNNRRRGYAIDHNHETGQFRGILCLPCNSMLGMAKDNSSYLRKAADYLDNRGSYYGKLLEIKAKKNG